MSFQRFCRLSGSCGPLEFEATFPLPRSSRAAKLNLRLSVYMCVRVCVCIVEQALCPRKFEYKTVHVIRIARPRSKKFRVLGENWIYPPWIGSEGKRMERKFYCDIERWKLLRIIVFSRLRVLLLALVWFQFYFLSLFFSFSHCSTRFDSSVFFSVFNPSGNYCK